MDPSREWRGYLWAEGAGEQENKEWGKGHMIVFIRSELRPRDRRVSGGAGSVVSSREVHVWTVTNV